MPNTPLLTTDRLILRRFTPDDMEALYAILSDEEANEFLPWFPVQNMKETIAFYREHYAAAYQLPDAYAYAICLKSDGIPVGYIGFKALPPYDLGYGLRRELWNNGIMTGAGKALIEQAKADGIPYLTATHDRNNPRSGRVMRKLGMKYCYSYEELWQPKSFPVIFRMYQLNLNVGSGFVDMKYWNMYENHFIEEIEYSPG